MNDKITLPDLIAALSAASGKPRTLCEKFLKCLLATVAETVVAGESVKIKGLGTFKVSLVDERKSVNVNTGEQMVIPVHRKISFAPDKHLAEEVNAPFAMFEPVELDDSVTDEMMEAAPAEEHTPHPDPKHAPSALESENITPPAPAPEPQKSEVDPEKDTPTPDLFEEAVEEQFSEPLPQEAAPEASPMPAPESIKPSQPAATDVKEPTEQLPHPAESITVNTDGSDSTVWVDEDEDSSGKHVEIHVRAERCRAPGFGKGILLGIAAAFVGIALLLVAWRLLLPASFCTLTGTSLPIAQIAENERTAVPAIVAEDTPLTEDTAPIEPIVEAADSVPSEVAPTVASDTPPAKEEKVYDVITKKRFLTTMAKEHYGDYNLWPFIYDENKKILGHPDRIKPGTRVVIPPASKYGIDASNPACVARAKKRGAEIYARYNK